MKKKKNKYEELIKLDDDLSFDEALRIIVNAPKKDIDEAIKKEKKTETEPDFDLEETE